MSDRMEWLRINGGLGMISSAVVFSLVVIGLMINDEGLGALVVAANTAWLFIAFFMKNKVTRIDAVGTPMLVKDLPDGLWVVKAEIWSGNSWDEHCVLVENTGNSTMKRFVASHQRLPAQFQINRDDLPVFQAIVPCEGHVITPQTT